MNRVQAGVLVALFVLGLAPLATGAPALAVGASAHGTDGYAQGTGAHSLAGAGQGAPASAAVDADSVEFRITVFENASARWTFTYTRVLENETERQQFESFAEEFEQNETRTYRDFRDLAIGLAAKGRNSTDRDMQARQFSRSASLGGTCVTQDCGTITMGFTWTEFAVADGDRLVIGDVFGTGLYISPDMELVIEAGPELAFASASPEDYNDPDVPLAERDSITFRGEKTFADRRPRAVFVPAPDQPSTDRTATATTSGRTTGSPSQGTSTDAGGGSLPMALVGVLVVLLGAGAAFAYYRGGLPGAIPTGDTPDDGSAGAAAGGAGVSGQPAVPDEELLTDEDRVLSLLEDSGGRMKQVDIVEETGWSKSKVSMLLSEMEDDDQISKLRVGRENIISLAGHEPEAAGSPHEEGG